VSLHLSLAITALLIALRHGADLRRNAPAFEVLSRASAPLHGHHRPNHLAAPAIRAHRSASRSPSSPMRRTVDADVVRS